MEYGNGTKLAGELTRIDICDMLLASLHVKFDFEREVRDESTTDERREIAKRDAKKWEALHAKLKAQLKAWDDENGI